MGDYHVTLEMRLLTGEEQTLVEVVNESGAVDQDEAAAYAKAIWEPICASIKVTGVAFKQPQQRRRSSAIFPR